MSNIIAGTNDNFSQDHFELLNFKLTILEGGLYWWPFREVSDIIAETTNDFFS